MDIEVDQELMEAFARNPSTLEFLLQRNPSICITEQTVINAAYNHDALYILIDKRLEDIPMSEQVMEVVVRAACEGHVASLNRILTHFGSKVPITERILVIASDILETLQLLLQEPGLNIPLPLSEKVVSIATYRDVSALTWLLERFGSAVPLTERVMVFVAGVYPTGVELLLQEWPTHVDLNQLWKAIWGFKFDSDFPYDPEIFMLWDLPDIQERAAKNILRDTREIDLSEEIFAQTPTVKCRRRSSLSKTVIFRDLYSGLLPLIKVCIKEKLPVPATEQLMRVVLDKSDPDIMKAIHTDLERFRSLDDHQPGKFEEMLWSHICEEYDGSNDLEEC
ncbi:hypothetical protein N7540_002572 [Penicillium herquei]|nr:hypothetical protein N7540_002572 [Penicillium herquei]